MSHQCLRHSLNWKTKWICKWCFHLFTQASVCLGVGGQLLEIGTCVDLPHLDRQLTQIWGSIISDNHSCAPLILSGGRTICFVIHCDNIDCFHLMVVLKPVCSPINGKMHKEIKTFLSVYFSNTSFFKSLSYSALKC